MITRRSFVFATFGTALLPSTGVAVTPNAAQAMVESLVRDVNDVIESGASETAMITRFGQILDRYADVSTIARYCLGADARRVTDAELSRYTTAFQGYIAAKYGRRFREFVGGEVRVVGAKPVKSWVEVETAVMLRGRSPLRMDWHVSDRSGRDAFFNFIIEGVNMLLTEREEVGAMLDRRRGSIDALISDMNDG